MCIRWLRTVASVVLLALLVTHSQGGEPRRKAEDAKPPIVLPKDPKAVVLSYDPGAGGFIRKGPPPHLKIQADGQVTVTNLVDGTKKESKLTPKQLDELLGFVIQEKDFFKVTAARINEGIKEASKNGPF